MTSSRILLGVTGGVAAYKVAALASQMAKQGLEIQPVLSRGGQQFLGGSTLAALANASPVIDTYDPRFPLGAHIELAESADLLVIAPATARILASCALGMADDLIATLYLAVECPVLMAPAMSVTMWEKPSVQRNVQRLREDGVHLVGPDSGWLSCRKQGAGRMAEPEAILARCMQLLQPSA